MWMMSCYLLMLNHFAPILVAMKITFFSFYSEVKLALRGLKIYTETKQPQTNYFKNGGNLKEIIRGGVSSSKDTFGRTHSFGSQFPN